MRGGVCSLLIALLHLVLATRPQLYRYFGAAELAQLHEQGSPFTVLVTIGMALMFASWGLYGLSGGGIIRPLPWLRGALITIGVIYVLRGLMLAPDILKAIQGGNPPRFIVLSTASLIIGLLHLYGVWVR